MRPAAVPAGFLGMLALLAAVEGAIGRRAVEFLPPGAWDCRHGVRAARRVAKDCDLLVFGDSLVKLAVLPRVIEARTGLKGYNLAICGGQPPMALALLKRALAAGARPKVILVHFSRRLLQFPPGFVLEPWPELLGPVEAAGLAFRARDLGLFGPVVAGAALPSLAARPLIRARLAHAWRGEGDDQRRRMARFIRDWDDHAGAQVMPSNPLLRGFSFDVAGFVANAFPDQAPHPTNAADLRRFLDLAAARGIAVVWVQPPVLPAIQDGCARSGAEAAQTEFLRDLQARHANLTILDGRRAGYDPGVFMDPNHLGHEGAYPFSLDLADALREVAGGSRPGRRWAALPAYVARAPDPAFVRVEGIPTAFAGLAPPRATR